MMLTCAGRRNYLVRFFQEALAGRGLVIAADASRDAPALREADVAFVVPPITDSTYFDVILDICKSSSVRLLISLNDLELPLLAQERDRFSEVGTLPVVSGPDVIDICFDKWKAYLFLKSNDLATPNTYLSISDACEALKSGELAFPVVVKPRWGTASIGIEYVRDSNGAIFDVTEAHDNAGLKGG